MEIEAWYNFEFTTSNQLDFFVKLLIKKKRLSPLVAAYLKNKGDKKWNKYDTHFDTPDQTVSETSIKGNTMCFNEWDPKNLMPELLKEVSEKYPQDDFACKLELAFMEGNIEARYSYKDGSYDDEINENIFE